MALPPTDWRSSGDLEQLLDADAARLLCAEGGIEVVSLTPNYLRLKTAESAVVGYSATMRRRTDSPDVTPAGDHISEPLHVRTFSDAQRAASIVDKWQGRKRVGDGIALVGSSVVFTFPNDSELRGLRHAVAPHGWKRLMRESTTMAGEPMPFHSRDVEVVRYKPGRRVVGRVALRHHDTDEHLDAFFRYFGSPGAARLAALATMLERSGVPVPRVIATGYSDRLVVEQLVAGVDATGLQRDGRLDLSGVLEVVRQLHRATTTLGGAGHVETLLTADVAIAESLDALDAIAVIAPTLAEEVMRVAVTLRTAPRPPVATVRLHGDLHLDQFLVAGDRVTVVDLERSRLGAPGYDLGCLAGHLVELACRPGHHPAARRIIDAVASNWQAVGGNPDDLHPVFACTGLVRRALLAVRSFDHRLPDLAASLLHSAATVIEAPRFVTLHLRPKGDWSAVIRTDEGTARAVLGTSGITMVDAAGDSALVGLETAQQRGTLVAHRPGRRAVIASRSGSYLKVTPPHRAAQLADRHRLVHDHLRGIDGIRSPAVIAFDADLGILELEGMTGTPLVDTLASDSAAARHTAIARTASVLAALSGLDLAAGDADSLPHLPIAGDGGSTSQWAAVASGLYPSLAALHRPAVEQIDTLFGRYERRTLPGRATFSHGDFHDKNLFLADDHAAIIDLDAAGVGDPLVDQGNLIAHVELRGLQRGDSTDLARADGEFLLDALGQVVSHAYGNVDDYLAAVRLHTARTLHRLSVVYRCRARWAHLAPELLNESWRWSSMAAAHPSLAPQRPR